MEVIPQRSEASPLSATEVVHSGCGCGTSPELCPPGWGWDRQSPSSGGPTPWPGHCCQPAQSGCLRGSVCAQVSAWEPQGIEWAVGALCPAAWEAPGNGGIPSSDRWWTGSVWK